MIIIEDVKSDYNMGSFPKLLALHAAMKALPTLGPYFASDMYRTYAHNNGVLHPNPTITMCQTHDATRQ